MPEHRRSSENGVLAVSLAASSGETTQIEATITNVGTTDLNLLKLGTILDDRPVKKLTVVSESGRKALFMGIELSLYHDLLSQEHFKKLSAGSSITRVIDVRTMFDLEPGTYSVSAEGSLPIGPAGSIRTKASQTVASYKSNAISITIDKSSTTNLEKGWSKRTMLQSNCTAAHHKATIDGIRNCESLARAAAADAADVTSARFVEYFKSNQTKDRQHVSGRLLAVAEECSSSNSGETRVFCQDDVGYCESDGPLLAYTTWVNGYIVMCPLFYDTLPPLPKQCHKQDHATTTIHEMTHARPVYPEEVATNDYAYGYENSTALDPLSCLYNADNYSLYSNAVYLDC
ncbi:hypothetical protein QQX98_008170 [Neonectria punicea]|uniref:Neutral protease 2 n=1 Tax=Neonectria punicea TaxID=979145 RepID=A0ABR1GVU9_9HYPO